MDLVSLFFHIKFSERSSIFFEFSFQSCHLSNQAFDDVTNSHTRWDTVRIDNKIWNNAINSKRQILLPKSHSTSSLLPMPTGKLIPNLRNPNTPNPNLHNLLALKILTQNNHINNPFFRPPRPQTNILSLNNPFQHPLLLRRFHRLPHKYLLILYIFPRGYNTIRIQFCSQCLIYIGLYTGGFLDYCVG